jgi:urease accessory protein
MKIRTLTLVKICENTEVRGYVKVATRYAAKAALLSMIVHAPASAHSDTGLAGGLASGFLHPLAGPDHMLAMISVGLWGAFLGRPLIIALPTIFPLMMVVGGALGMFGIAVPPVEVGIAFSLVILGLVILLALRAPVAVACLVVAIFALFHGYAHGTELPSAADPVGYSAGFVLCTGMLHLFGIGLGTLKRYRGGSTALRGAGGIIAACGVYYMARALGA